MKIFVDLGHPAHVHYFKNLIFNLKHKGHEFLITARDKDVSQELLDNYDIPYISRGKGSDSLVGKFFYLLKANFQLFKLARDFKPDILLSFASPYASQLSSIINKPHIAFTDTEHAKLGILSFLPFTNIVLTPDVYKSDHGDKHIRFHGYMEQCYLQKEYFRPNNKILKKLKLKKSNKFVIIRLVSWKASHDIGHKGFSLDYLERLIELVENHAKVFISVEGDIPEKLEKYKLSIDPTEIHNILYYAELFIGEGATMASECAVLGTPSIYVNSLSAGSLESQSKENLIYLFNSTDGVLEKAGEILRDDYYKVKQRKIKEKALKQKVDVNKLIEWFILNYPKSSQDLKKNPSLQFKVI
tara:strand:+ start:1616 stop:2686 length:1071 start_codon:yes stop_codon:yes gene_type:complete